MCVCVCVWVCVRATTINPAIENFPLFISLFLGIFSPTLETTQHFGPRHRNLNHNLYHNRTIAAQLLIVPSSSTFPSCPASLSLCHPPRPLGHPCRWLNKKYTRMFTLIHSLQVKFLVQLLILFLAGDFIACLPACLPVLPCFAWSACKCFAAALARLCSCFMPHRFFRYPAIRSLQ